MAERDIRIDRLLKHLFDRPLTIEEVEKRKSIAVEVIRRLAGISGWEDITEAYFVGSMVREGREGPMVRSDCDVLLVRDGNELDFFEPVRQQYLIDDIRKIQEELGCTDFRVDATLVPRAFLDDPDLTADPDSIKQMIGECVSIPLG